MAPIITPQGHVEHSATRRGIRIEDWGVAPTVVVSWMRGVVTSLAETTGATMSEHWIYGEQHPLYTAELDGAPVSFALVRVGAPATVIMMEELIACGARTFIGLGLAGSVNPLQAPVGTLVIPTGCISEEGTSAHYVDEGTPLTPTPALVDAVADACTAEGVGALRGKHWTTDAPYRELRTKVAAYRQEGVLSVDMETSAMYAVARFRGVEVCNLLAISDELRDEWHPAFGSPELREAEKVAERAVLGAVRAGR